MLTSITENICRHTCIYLRVDYPSGPLNLLMSREQSKFKPIYIYIYIYATLLCIFLKLKLCFAEMMDLVDLTCFAADHMRWDKFSTNCID